MTDDPRDTPSDGLTAVYPLWLRPCEAARIAGVSPATVRKWESDRRFGRVFRLHGTVRYHGGDFVAFLEEAAADDKTAAMPPAWREAERPASMPASMRRRPRAA